ncbi:calcium-binding protein [Phenylobacterium immobile]|uniref:calcium-binding protein n=1 Tax=Phenylobacterium immobile TaxID=21 RepID=UPI000AEF586E|nr:calcium-binding protein [Phenylobacterium immobile]
MATYNFATITAAQAAGATTADDILVSGAVSANQATVLYVPPVVTPDATTPATIQITIGGVTKIFGAGISGANNVFVFGDGSQLYVGFQASGGGDVGATNAGNDALFGLAGNDALSGGAGNDLLQGNQGQDTLTGGVGSDTIYGGQGDDLIVASAGDSANFVNGNLGEDTINGSAAADTLLGGQGDDTINAGAGSGYISGDLGDDEINGGAGSSSIFGGAGEDYIFTGNGNDTVDAGADDDHIDTGDDAVTVSGGEGDDLIHVDGTAGQLSGQMNGNEGDDFISGSTGHDFFLGGQDNDTLIGNGGNDTLSGDSGADFLDGGAGRDVLQGGASDDTLDGGTGQDILSGGTGSDTFMFDAADSVPPTDSSDVDTLVGNADTIIDWTSVDILDFGLGVMGDAFSYREIVDASITDYGDALDAAILAKTQDPFAVQYVAVQLGANVLVFSHAVDLDPGAGFDWAFSTVVQINGISAANIGADNFV